MSISKQEFLALFDSFREAAEVANSEWGKRADYEAEKKAEKRLLAAIDEVFDQGPSFAPAEALAAQREYADTHSVMVPHVPVPTTVEEATRILEAAGFKVQR